MWYLYQNEFKFNVNGGRGSKACYKVTRLIPFLKHIGLVCCYIFAVVQLILYYVTLSLFRHHRFCIGIILSVLKIVPIFWLTTIFTEFFPIFYKFTTFIEVESEIKLRLLKKSDPNVTL